MFEFLRCEVLGAQHTCHPPPPTPTPTTTTRISITEASFYSLLSQTPRTPHDAHTYRDNTTIHSHHMRRNGPLSTPFAHQHHTLPSEAHNLAVVLLLCGYACWVLRAVVRFYQSWRIRTKCLPQERVVLIEGLGHRVNVSGGGLRVGQGRGGRVEKHTKRRSGLPHLVAWRR